MSQQALPCTPPPPRMIEGGFIFFVWVSSVTKIFPKKMDFLGDIRIGTHQNVVLRHNHLNPISTKLTSFDNNE